MPILTSSLFIILAIVAGMAMPIQATLNGRLSLSLQSPVAAAFVSFVVGTVALFVYLIVSGFPLGHLTSVRTAPPITWTGGLLGAFFVTVMALTVPRIGVALAFSLAIAGQMLLTVVIDHFGWLDTPERPVTLLRLLGAGLVTAGVVLIRRF